MSRQHRTSDNRVLVLAGSSSYSRTLSDAVVGCSSQAGTRRPALARALRSVSSGSQGSVGSCPRTQREESWSARDDEWQREALRVAVEWDLPLGDSPGPVHVEKLAAGAVQLTPPRRLPTPDAHEGPGVGFRDGLLTQDQGAWACPARGPASCVHKYDAAFITAWSSRPDTQCSRNIRVT